MPWHQGLDVDLVNGKHASELGGGAALPTGIIVMWSGAIANIPSGWVLCDGTNGTPDLRDKFVKGVPAGQNPGGTGGSNTHTHASHPSLSHSGTAVADHPAAATSQADVGSSKTGTTSSTVTLKAHTHNTPVLTHSVTQPDAHPELTHDAANNEPEYFLIAFIMKV
jgi:hypothetical protein